MTDREYKRLLAEKCIMYISLLLNCQTSDDFNNWYKCLISSIDKYVDRVKEEIAFIESIEV